METGEGNRPQGNSVSLRFNLTRMPIDANAQDDNQEDFDSFHLLILLIDKKTLISLPFLCVEAHAQAEGIDGEREDNCRTLLCGDRIERLKKPSVRHRWSEDERENQNKWTNRAIVWFFGDMEKSN